MKSSINSILEEPCLFFKELQLTLAYRLAVFLEKVNPLDYDIKVGLMQEYMELYGSVLLDGEELLNPYELAVNLRAVIQNHVRLVNEYRKTLQ